MVPAYNEAARIGDTLRGAGRADRPRLHPAGGRQRLHRRHRAGGPATSPPARRCRCGCCTSRRRASGCAVDTGFRHADRARARGCWPAPTPTACRSPAGSPAARAALAAGAGMVCGRIVARRDEHGPLGRAGFRGAGRRWRPSSAGSARRTAGGGYLAPYRMHAGNNMAITADALPACRRHAPAAVPDRPDVPQPGPPAHRRDPHGRTMVVENSTRRLRAYGLRRTAGWYLDRGSGRPHPGSALMLDELPPRCAATPTGRPCSAPPAAAGPRSMHPRRTRRPRRRVRRRAAPARAARR